jgi:hypothetical protein
MAATSGSPPRTPFHTLSIPLSPTDPRPHHHTHSAFPLPPQSLDLPGPTSPLPSLLRAYQQALAAEQEAVDTIERLHREIAELVELQLNLQKLCNKSQSPSRNRLPPDAASANHARSLAVAQIQVLPLQPHKF